jgi:hypothetical protein
MNKKLETAEVDEVSKVKEGIAEYFQKLIKSESPTVEDLEKELTEVNGEEYKKDLKEQYEALYTAFGETPTEEVLNQKVAEVIETEAENLEYRIGYTNAEDKNEFVKEYQIEQLEGQLENATDEEEKEDIQFNIDLINAEDKTVFFQEHAIKELKEQLDDENTTDEQKKGIESRIEYLEADEEGKRALEKASIIKQLEEQKEREAKYMQFQIDYTKADDKTLFLKEHNLKQLEEQLANENATDEQKKHIQFAIDLLNAETDLDRQNITDTFELSQLKAKSANSQEIEKEMQEYLKSLYKNAGIKVSEAEEAENNKMMKELSETIEEAVLEYKEDREAVLNIKIDENIDTLEKLQEAREELETKQEVEKLSNFADDLVKEINSSEDIADEKKAQAVELLEAGKELLTGKVTIEDLLEKYMPEELVSENNETDESNNEESTAETNIDLDD